MKLRDLTYTSLFLALGVVLPFITASNPKLGQIFLLIHLPAFIAGLWLGPKQGFTVGLGVPLLRSILVGMPALFPTAFIMALEMATYGLTIGWVHLNLKNRKNSVLISLALSMLMGRLVWGVTSFAVYGLNQFNLQLFITGAFINAWPGILLQLCMIPLLMRSLKPQWKPKI